MFSTREKQMFARAFLLGMLVALLAHICLAGVPDDLRDSTVIVTDGYGHGSGVMFERDGRTFIWTAGHVADIFHRGDGTYREVTIKKGDQRGTARVIRGGDFTHDADFALLEVVEGNLESDSAGRVSFYRAFNCIRLGQRIVHCGTPYDKNWNERLIFFGRISAVEQYCAPILGLIATGRHLDHVDLTAGGGCSGGPVVDENTGGIVGLLVMGLRNGHRLNIIEPTRRLYAWAATHDCLWAVQRDVPIPFSIVPWLADSYLRECREARGDWDGQPGEPVLPVIIRTLKAALFRNVFGIAA